MIFSMIPFETVSSACVCIEIETRQIMYRQSPFFLLLYYLLHEDSGSSLHIENKYKYFDGYNVEGCRQTTSC